MTDFSNKQCKTLSGYKKRLQKLATRLKVHGVRLRTVLDEPHLHTQ